MKKSVLVLFAMLLSYMAQAVNLSAVVEGKKYLYQLGEEAKFTLTATNDDKSPLKDGKLHAMFTHHGKTIVKQVTFDLAKEQGPFTVSSTMDEPGLLRLNLQWENGKEKKTVMASVGCDVENITPGGTEPEDFWQFWQDGKANFAKNATVELTTNKLFTHELRTVYLVKVHTPSKKIIYGYLVIPKTGRKNYPLLVNVPGAGPGNFAEIGLADSGFAVLNMNVHPYEMPSKMADRQKLYNEFIKDGHYRYQGVPDREKYIFRDFFLGVDKAIDYVATLPEIDKDNIGMFGFSQGGASAIIVSALNDKIKATFACAPALCDHHGFKKNRFPGWPYFSGYVKGPEVLEMARYFDAVNFARYLKNPIRVSAGFIDTAASPVSVYAMYNQITAPKTMVNEPLMGHTTNGLYKQNLAWLTTLLYKDNKLNMPKSIMVKSKDLAVRFEGRSFWALSGVNYKGSQLGIDEWGSYYGNVFSFTKYGFVGTGHKENEDERVQYIKIFVDDKEVEKVEENYNVNKFKFEKLSAVRGLMVKTIIVIENNKISENTEIVARFPERLSYACLAMYCWNDEFSEYICLDDNCKEGEKFTNSNKFLLNKPCKQVAMYNPKEQKGVITTVTKAKNLGKHNEQYRDVKGRYRKHYTQTIIAEVPKQGEKYEFGIEVKFFDADENNWKDVARQAR